MSRMRYLIENNFTFVLILSCAAGLILPGISRVPDWSAGFVLGLLTFFSCFKLRDGGFSEIRWRRIIAFYLVRYGALPALLWFAAHAFVPSYATAVFLLALVPTAVSSPAFAHLFGGHVPSAFALVILSTLAAPFLIPLQFSWTGNEGVTPSPWFLFKTLSLCIFLPMVFYALVYKNRALSDYVYPRGKLIAIVLVAFIIALVIAKQRDIILADITALVMPLAINIGSFFIFLIVGWFFSHRAPSEERVTYAVCSSFNNVALSVSLALIHFPASVILFVAVSEMAWALLPAMTRAFLKLVRPTSS